MPARKVCSGSIGEEKPSSIRFSQQGRSDRSNRGETPVVPLTQLDRSGPQEETEAGAEIQEPAIKSGDKR